MLEKLFHLQEANTTVRRELFAGFTTFFTMAYIIFLQPAILTGSLFGVPTGMDSGSILVATILAAAFTTFLMGVYANYPVALAPGMGQNFFFAMSVIPAAAAAGYGNGWQTALGAVFVSGLLFLFISIAGIRHMVIRSVASSQKSAIGAGIGLFIALIGLQNSSLILTDQTSGFVLNPHVYSPDTIIFFSGLIVTAALHARKIPGSIFIGILFTLTFSLIFRAIAESTISEDGHLASYFANSMLLNRFTPASSIFSLPPSISPTFFQLDLIGAMSTPMIPFVIILLFMDLFDTTGTLVAVAGKANLLQGDGLVRSRQAFISDASGTVMGSLLGTSTVTTYIESASGVEQGGRTGLTAVTVSVLFLLALFVSPLIKTIGSYAPITAPALVLVGSMMIESVRRIHWEDVTEAFPAFVTISGIPFTYSISDGIALGLLSYPLVKIFSGRAKETNWIMNSIAVLIALYFIFLRSEAGV